MIKRAIILVHYDRDNTVDAYLTPYIEALKANSTHLVFISTAKLSSQEQEKLRTYCHTVIIRENIGYDFMSYQKGLESFHYQDYDEVLFCNDSVYGPLSPLGTLFDTMSQNTCDFWGITDNNDM